MERFLTDFQEKLAWFRKNPVTDWHEHGAIGAVKPGEDLGMIDDLIRGMDDCGIDRTAISRPVTGGAHVTPETIAAANDYVGRAVERYPDRLRGLAYADPVHGQCAVAEIDRCRRAWGAVGVKLYNQYTMDDDLQDPIIEYCIEHDMFILMHAGRMTRFPNDQPGISDSAHMARAAKKYPEAVLQMAHITGGGDWNWQLRGLEDCPNVYVDISGSVRDAGVLEALVAAVGAERVLFGTDYSFSTAIARLLGARISDADKLTIMENPAYRRFWERGMR